MSINPYDTMKSKYIYHYTKFKQKNVNSPANIAEGIPRNKLCVGIIGPYVIIRKGKKENLNLKDANIIDTVTMWFLITEYNDKIVITITNLVETVWLKKYPWTTETIYDQRSEFIGHEFIKYLI